MTDYLPALFRHLLALPTIVVVLNVLMASPVSAQSLVVREFCNTTPIVVSTDGFARGSIYPSPVGVSGVGEVLSVTATIKGITHSYIRDLDIWMSGPGAERSVVLLSDVGGDGPVSDLNVTVDDAAAGPAPAPLVSGRYRPTNITDNGTTDSWLPPAPSPNAAGLSTFAGTSGDGTWNLWVLDDAGGDAGTIAGGWCLTVTTAAPPIDGTCGSANTTTGLLTAPPSTNLCSVGSASTVGNDVDAYRWSCAGVNGGAPASCQAPRGYTVTPITGANGSISPSTPQVVAFHDTQSFTVTVNAGYSAGATGCSGALIGSTFTTSAVDEDCSVTASFTGNDSVPGAFGFVTQVGLGLSTLTTSNTITLTGLTAAANISVTNGEYQVNGGSFVSTPGTVNNGDTIAVRHISSASFLTQVTTTLTVGTVQGTFNTTTVAPPAVNGACGSSHNTGSTPLLTTAPASNLCSAGSALRVYDGLAAYRWSCAGTNGGSPASCGAPRGYTVTPSAGSNGGISPSTPQVVAYHAAPTFAVTANAGYAASVSGCGGTLAGSSYITDAITESCSVSASFGLITSYTALSPSGDGNITTQVAGDGPSCGLQSVSYQAASAVGATPPAGVTFPHGVVDFTTTSTCTPGGTLTVTLTYPNALPAGTQFWKYGPATAGASPSWYVHPATIAGNTITYSLTDNGQGDSNDTAGQITDPGGPGVSGSAAIAGIPTLSQWGVMALAALMALATFMKLRRRTT